MNEAFEKGDYEKALIMHKVKPELSFDIEMVKNRLRTIMSSLPENWIYTIRKIRNLSSVNLSDEIDDNVIAKICNVSIKEPFSQAVKEYKEIYGSFPVDSIKQFVLSYIPSHDPVIGGANVKDFIHESGAVLSSQDIVQLVKTLTSSDLIAWLKKLEVYLSPTQTQEVYTAIYLQKGQLDKRLVDFTGIAPESDLVKRMILDNVSARYINWQKIRSIIESFGVTDISYEEIGDTYVNELIETIYRNGAEFPLIKLLRIQPSTAIIKKAFRTIFLNTVFPVEEIKEHLQRLTQLTGQEAKLSSEELQGLYDDCIFGGNPLKLINLYELTGVKPALEKHVVQAFIYRLIGIYDHKTLKRILDIFDGVVTFSSEECTAMYDEIAESGNCNKLEQFAKMNGEDVPRIYIEKCARVLLLHFIDITLDGGDGNINSIAKAFIVNHAVRFSKADIETSYKKIIEGGRKWSALTQLYTLFGEFPKEQVNEHYKHIYAEFKKSGKVYELQDRLNAFYNLTHEKSLFSEEEMKDIVRAIIINMGLSVDLYSRIVRIYSGSISWSHEDIKQISMEIIKKQYIGKIQLLTQITGIDIPIDDDMRLACRERLASEFDTTQVRFTSNVDNIIGVTKGIKEMSGITPEPSDVQKAYDKILHESENWGKVISSLVTTTGIVPVFTEDQLKAKALREQSDGNILSLDQLRTFGSFELSKDEIEIVYEQLIEKNTSFDVISKIKERTAVSPNADQLAHIFLTLFKTGIKSQQAWSSIIKQFGNQSGLSVTLFSLLIEDRYYTPIKDLHEMNVLHVSPDDPAFQKLITYLVQTDNVRELKKIKSLFNYWQFPCDREVLNDMFNKCAARGVTKESLDNMAFFVDLTGMRPEFTEPALQALHLEALNARTSKLFCRLTHTEPNPETYLKAYTTVLDGSMNIHEFQSDNAHIKMDSELTKNLALTRFHAYVQTFRYGISDLSYVDTIAEADKPEIIASMEKDMVIAFETYVPHKYSAHGIVMVLSAFEKKFGRKASVSSDLIDRIIQKECIYVIDNRENDSLGFARDYFEKLWDYVVRNYSIPSYNGMAQTYFHVLETEEPYKQSGPITRPVNITACQSLEYLKNFFTRPPDKEYLIQLGLSNGMKDAGEKITSQINKLCKEAILHDTYTDLISLEQMFAYEYIPNPEDIQSLYAVILLSYQKANKELYDHMLLRTGILPDMSIIDAAYNTALEQANYASYVGNIRPIYDIVHVLPREDIIQELYNQKLKQVALMDDYIYAEGDHTVNLEHIEEIDELVAFTHVEPKYIADVIKEIVEKILAENTYDSSKLNNIIKFAYKHNAVPVSILEIALKWKVDSPEQMEIFMQREGVYVKYLLQNPTEPGLLTKEIVDEVKVLHLRYMEMELLIRSGLNLSDYIDKSKHEELFMKMVEVIPDWRDGGYADMFKQGAEIFGYTRIWAYSDKENLSRHDALHSIPNIISMMNASGLEPEQFYGNILKQIMLDDSSYVEGNAHQHFNAIVNSFNFDIASVLQLASEFSDIPSLQILLKNFDSPKAVFNSWNTLKKYIDIAMQLEKKEAFEQLRELKNKGKIQEFQYYETLLFHPDSKVSVSEVIKLMRDPENFLAGSATHTPDHIQNAKKPSNYLQIRNLDLSAPELRDGLIEGKLDALQAFPPMEITYTIPVIKGIAYHSFYEVVSYALGSRSKGLEGAANNPNALLKRVSQIFREHTIDLGEYLTGKVSIDAAIQRKIETVLYDASIGLAKKNIEWQTYVAKICLKSDPQAIIAGNDTAGCDPFGDGKKTVYTFNMNTNQFTIQMVRTEGGKQILKTVAQSTVTKDIDLHRDVPSLIKDLSVQQGKLTDALPVEITYDQTAVLSCDNIEVAANYKDVNKKVIIQMIYENFMRDYLKQYAAQSNLQPDQFIVGCEGYEGGYARNTSWPEALNTFAPQAPVSYSDKNGEHVKVVKIQETKEIGAKNIHIPETTPLANPEVSIDTKGIELLTYEDTMKAAWLEGKLFADNQALVFGLHAVENALMAKDINNAIKGRPNLSVKYVNNDGITQGYMIAYEGKLGAGNIGHGDETDEGEAIIYIEDVAAPKNSLTGGRLMQGFVELYAKNYLEKGILMPIFAEARESTSYRLVQRQLQKIGEKLNIDFDLEEGTVNEVMEHNGNAVDFMHSITIRPRRKEQSS